MRAADWAVLALLSLLWGATFPFAKLALAEIPPLSLVALRVLIAALCLLGLLSLRREKLDGALARWRDALLLGILNNVIPFTFLFLGQRHLSAGLASILNATTPIFTVLVLHFATSDERLTPLKLAGVGLGFAGVVVLVGPEALLGVNDHVTAELLCLAATFSYALALLVGRRFRGTPPLVTAASQLTASSLIMVPLSLAIDQPWTLPLPGTTALLCAATLATVSTALAYILYFRILTRAGATNAALVTFLIPVSAITLGAAMLGEKLMVAQAIGLGLILLGLAAIDGRLFAARKRRLTAEMTE